MMTSELHRPTDPEAPEEDVLEQEQEVEPDVSEGSTPRLRPRDPEVPEADALEQEQEVPYGDEDY